MPAGFPSVGSVKLTSYNPDTWHSGDLAPDGSGTYDLNNLELRADLFGIGPGSFLRVDSTHPAFENQSVLVCAWWSEYIFAFEIDGRGDPIQSTSRRFVYGSDYEARVSP